MADAAKARKPPGFWFLDSPREKLPPDRCEDWDCCGRCRLYEVEEAEAGEGGDDDSVSATVLRGECRRGEVAGVETALLALVLLGLRLRRE